MKNVSKYFFIACITLNTSYTALGAAAAVGVVNQDLINEVKRYIDRGDQRGFDSLLQFVPEIVPLQSIVPQTGQKLVDYALDVKKADPENPFKRQIFAYLSALYTTNLIDPNSVDTVQGAKDSSRDALIQDLFEIKRAPRARKVYSAAVGDGGGVRSSSRPEQIRPAARGRSVSPATKEAIAKADSREAEQVAKLYEEVERHDAFGQAYSEARDIHNALQKSLAEQQAAVLARQQQQRVARPPAEASAEDKFYSWLTTMNPYM